MSDRFESEDIHEVCYATWDWNDDANVVGWGDDVWLEFNVIGM